jgi:hypothetical protein
VAEAATLIGTVGAGSPIEAALEAVADRRLDPDSRAPLYAVLYQTQLRITRHLRPVADELIATMLADGLRTLADGDLALRARGVGVEWPCNDPGNWTDDGVQESLASIWADRKTQRYIRAVPAHFEVDTLAIQAGFVEGDPSVVELHRRLSDAGYRTERERRPSLVVRERRPSLVVRDVAGQP